MHPLTHHTFTCCDSLLLTAMVYRHLFNAFFLRRTGKGLMCRNSAGMYELVCCVQFRVRSKEFWRLRTCGEVPLITCLVFRMLAVSKDSVLIQAFVWATMCVCVWLFFRSFVKQHVDPASGEAPPCNLGQTKLAHLSFRHWIKTSQKPDPGRWPERGRDRTSGLG